MTPEVSRLLRALAKLLEAISTENIPEEDFDKIIQEVYDAIVAVDEAEDQDEKH
jgi:hypothetical protein